MVTFFKNSVQFFCRTIKKKSTLTSIKGYDIIPASILYKSTAGHYRPVSYPDGPITARYRFIKNAYWDIDNLNLISLHTS